MAGKRNVRSLLLRLIEWAAAAASLPPTRSSLSQRATAADEPSHRASPLPHLRPSVCRARRRRWRWPRPCTTRSCWMEMRRAPPQARHTRYVCLLADKPRVVLFTLRVCMLHLHVPALPHGRALDRTAYTCIPCKHAAFGQRVTKLAPSVCPHAILDSEASRSWTCRA